MGKASRKKGRQGADSTPKVAPAPFVRRPFEGMTGETDLVAMREIVPAATVTLRLDQSATALVEAAAAAGVDVPAAVDVVSVLPMAWPGMHRGDGRYLVGLQSGASTSDPSRDYAQVILDLLATPEGQPLVNGTRATAATPRLQDLVADGPFDVTVHDDFGFWLAEGTELDAEGAASLREANDAIWPTVKLTGAQSAYWVRVGDRTHIRWILPYDEDDATNALARLHAAGTDLLGEGTRLLGCFRACGLLAPVWDLDPDAEATAYDAPMAAVDKALKAALKKTSALTPDERRAKAGILSRQLTLR